MTKRTMEPTPDDSRLLSRTMFRVGEIWDLSDRQLALAIGVTESDIGDLRQDRIRLKPATEPFVRTQTLLRAYRSLDRLLAGDEVDQKAWLRTHNIDFDARPIDLIGKEGGLIVIAGYLEHWADRQCLRMG